MITEHTKVKRCDAPVSCLRWARGLVIGLLFAPLAQAQLMLHGDGSHGNGCLINSGTTPVGFTAYLVPATQSEPLYQAEALCDHLPQPGSFSLTVDLYDQALRTTPIVLRLVKETGLGVKEIQSWPAQTYPSGNVIVMAHLDQPGQYALLLDTRKTTASPTPDVRIPFHVGRREGSYSALIGAVLLLAGAIVWWKRKKST